MEYIEFQGKKISMLGYGAMRLPTLGNDDQIDYEEAERLFDRAIEAGINYFDTAYPYHGGNSEIVTGKLLKKYPRESYYLASKFPGFEATELEKKEEIFEPKEVDVTDLVWAEPAVFTSDEAQSVKVYLKAPCDQQGNVYLFEDHFRVKFEYANPNDILRIEIFKKPEKLTYTVGENLDTTGMTVRLHKGDGSAEDVTEGFKTDVTKFDEAGTKTVTVTYGEGEKAKTATFDVTVNEKVEEPVSSSSSSSEPEPPVSSESSSEEELPVSSESSSEEELPVSSESSSEEEVPVSSESSSEEEIIVIGGEVEEDKENCAEKNESFEELKVGIIEGVNAC